MDLPIKITIDAGHLVALINHSTRLTMTAIGTLAEKVGTLTQTTADLQTQVAAGNDKADALITAMTSLRDQLAAMQAGGATPEQVAALSAQIDAALASTAATAASVAEQVAQDDAALAPAAPAEPETPAEPAPVDPPAEDPPADPAPETPAEG